MAINDLQSRLSHNYISDRSLEKQITRKEWISVHPSCGQSQHGTAQAIGMVPAGCFIQVMFIVPVYILKVKPM
jgi:hypothetical protein